QARVKEYLLEQAIPDEEHSLEFTLHRDPDGLRLVLAPPPEAAASGPQRLVSPPLELRGDKARTVAMTPLLPGAVLADPLPVREVLQHRDALMALKLDLPDHRVIGYTGVHEFGPSAAVWRANGDGSLTRVEDGKVYKPDAATGFYESAD